MPAMRVLAARNTVESLMPKVVAIIPVRLASTRLPGKPLAAIGGKPMVQWVHERVTAAEGIDRVLVATDDPTIAETVRGFDGIVAMTGTHPTGTDRLAEVARTLDVDVIVNVQGDLPLLDPTALTACVRRMTSAPMPAMASLMTPIRTRAELDSPHVVKVVVDGRGDALYFSRSPIPHWRGAPTTDVLAARHIGLYAYRKDVLLMLAATPRTPLERAEELEQLRALERGVRIAMVEVDSAPPEVDTAEDLARVRRLVEEEA